MWGLLPMGVGNMLRSSFNALIGKCSMGCDFYASEWNGLSTVGMRIKGFPDVQVDEEPRCVAVARQRILRGRHPRPLFYSPCRE